MKQPEDDAGHDPAREPFRRAFEQAQGEAAMPAGLPTLAGLAALFPEYEVASVIGRGGMGAVYRAHDPRLDRPVAIKVLPPHLRADPAFAERFAREARTLAKLQHPHILTVFDYGEREGLPFLVTEFVDGLDLRRLMAAERIDPAEALRIVPQVCDALQYAHERGVVHRDIKPENILIDTRGHVKVADFGIARLLGVQAQALPLTSTNATLGTPHYTAPEVLRGHDFDHRADIFGLGVVLYELLTGLVPLGHFRAPSERAGTDPRLDAVVARALRDEPQDRYQRVSDLRADLEGLGLPQTPQAAAAVPAPPAAPAPRPSLGRGIFKGCLVILILMVVGFMAMLLIFTATSVAP